MYSDLTDFLSDLDKRRLLARVPEPVSPDLEIAAVDPDLQVVPEPVDGSGQRHELIPAEADDEC